MNPSSPLATSTFQNLPTELVLAICSHVSLHDLFFDVRPTCRRLSLCAHEVLLGNFFNHSYAYVSWNSVCSLFSDLSLNVVLKDITALFSTPANLHTKTIRDRTEFAKLAFGEIYGEPKVHFSIGDEEGEITVRARELQECLRFAPKDLQARRYAFLMFFFHEAAEREELACYDGTVVGGTYARLHYIGDFAFCRRCCCSYPLVVCYRDS